MNMYQDRQIQYRMKQAKKSIRRAKTTLERYSRGTRRAAHLQERIMLKKVDSCSF